MYDPEPCHVTVSAGVGVGYSDPTSTNKRSQCSPSRTPATVFSITDTAADKVKSLITAEGNPELVLRVAVRPGGCSGLSYEMFFDTDIAADDVKTEHGGITVVIDPASAAHLGGASLDFKDGLQGAGFSINNPNATRSCGCGQSFSSRDEPVE